MKRRDNHIITENRTPRLQRAIIFHGTDGTPADYWYPWLAQRLDARGYSVEVPSYPNINHEPAASFLPEVLKRHVLDEHTVLIGHSAGGPLVLASLSTSTSHCRKRYS